MRRRNWPPKFAPTSRPGRAAARRHAGRSAHRSDAVGGLGASGQAEVAAGVGGRREAAARNARTFVWRSRLSAWTAEREIAQQRDRELQDELQAVRVRIVELEEALEVGARGAGCGARSPRRTVGRAGAREVRRAAHGRNLRAGVEPAARRADGRRIAAAAGRRRT